jgi:hypothetical protein
VAFAKLYDRKTPITAADSSHHLRTAPRNLAFHD